VDFNSKLDCIEWSQGNYYHNMASLLHSFDPPMNGSVVSKVTSGGKACDTDEKHMSQNTSEPESAILLGPKDVNGDDISKRQVLCVRKTRSGGHKTYMATDNELQMVYSCCWL